jgi:hypothetical protein
MNQNTRADQTRLIRSLLSHLSTPESQQHIRSTSHHVYNKLRFSKQSHKYTTICMQQAYSPKPRTPIHTWITQVNHHMNATSLQSQTTDTHQHLDHAHAQHSHQAGIRTCGSRLCCSRCGCWGSWGRCCAYTCMCVCLYVCMCVCVYVCMFVCVYVCMCVCACILYRFTTGAQYLNMHVCTYACMYVCMCPTVCVWS